MLPVALRGSVWGPFFRADRYPLDAFFGRDAHRPLGGAAGKWAAVPCSKHRARHHALFPLGCLFLSGFAPSPCHLPEHRPTSVLAPTVRSHDDLLSGLVHQQKGCLRACCPCLVVDFLELRRRNGHVVAWVHLESKGGARLPLFLGGDLQTHKSRKGAARCVGRRQTGWLICPLIRVFRHFSALPARV